MRIVFFYHVSTTAFPIRQVHMTLCFFCHAQATRSAAQGLPWRSWSINSKHSKVLHFSVADAVQLAVHTRQAANLAIRHAGNFQAVSTLSSSNPQR